MPQVLRGPQGFSIRAWVGGVLYIEGIIVLLLGSTLLFGYWPPYPHDGEPRNPISLVGLVICLVALAYMFTVGLGLFVYNLFKPGTEEKVDPLRERAWRYSRMRAARQDYLFDNTLECEDDAEEAYLARQLY